MHVLLVEDDRELAARLSRGLSQAGFMVERAVDGEDGLNLGLRAAADVIVLDLGLPRIPGLKVLKEWRKQGITTPVLILTARGTWNEKVEGLNEGADDYLTKPFHLPELVARLHALRRRVWGRVSNLLQHEDIVVNLGTGQVMRNEELLELTALELKLLKYFMNRVHHVISQQELVEYLYDTEDARESNTIEVYISRLRRKIGPHRIKTLRGQGYRFQ